MKVFHRRYNPYLASRWASNRLPGGIKTKDAGVFEKFEGLLKECING
jgi:hypothetical protein